MSGQSITFPAIVQGVSREVTATVVQVEAGVRTSFTIPGFPVSPVLILPRSETIDLAKMMIIEAQAEPGT